MKEASFREALERGGATRIPPPRLSAMGNGDETSVGQDLCWVTRVTYEPGLVVACTTLA